MSGRQRPISFVDAGKPGSSASTVSGQPGSYVGVKTTSKIS